MKKRLIGFFLFGVVPFVVPADLFAQGQALYFSGTNQHAEFTAPAGMPSGSTPRTIEFWVRSGLRVGAKDNHEPIVELGEQAHDGSAFGIFTQIAGGKTQLCFWGHNAVKIIGEIPDDQWHFIAITYTEPNLKCYIDGELKSTNPISTAVGGQRLNTKTGKCYIGGFPSRGWYFNGAVDNLSIWSGERTVEQIKKDMIPYPCIQGSEAGLVAHFRLNEATGTTFKNPAGTVTGTLKNGASWTKPVVNDPDPISEGVWFVIQNKSDADADTDPAARRMALKAPATGMPTMAQIPLTGNYDDFLWRTISLGGGKFKLVNKKLGMAKALDSSPANPTIGDYGGYSGQSWTLSATNAATMGTNVYTMTNDFITPAKALAFANNQVVVAAANKSDTKQAWVFQPMCLVEGYHIPKTDDANCPTTKLLSAGAIKIYGTNTASDWAMLNTQLIIKNMVNALEVPSSALNNERIYIITRYDYDPDLISKYPLVGIPSAWIGATRGGQHGGHNLTMVTEEMMCRVGVYSRRNDTPPDVAYREFDQVVHEFGHTIDGFCQQNGAATPVCCFSDAPQECYAASVQAWFNNNFSYGEPCQRNRQLLKSKQVALYNYMDRAFKADNTWMPPRILREAYDVTKK